MIQQIQQDSPEDYRHKVAFVEAITELNRKEKQILSSQNHTKAYFLSVFLPPIGIYYFFKYLFFVGGDKESIKAGVISLLLTFFSLVLSFWLMMALFKQTGGGSSENLQILQNIAAPENQKTLMQLYK